jgi:hypothetical protein
MKGFGTATDILAITFTHDRIITAGVMDNDGNIVAFDNGVVAGTFERDGTVKSARQSEPWPMLNKTA